MLPGDDWWSGTTGTRTIGRGILAADAHENIVAHVVVWCTPGGSTVGLEEFAGIVAGTQKPLVSYAQQMCSAGYWAGSGANGGLLVAGRTAILGSIGTKAEFLDFSGMLQQMGIQQVTVLATASTNKNASFDAAIAGNHKPLQKELLDPLNEVFLSTVRANRAGQLDPKQEKELLSGLVYVGQANVDNGLADALGSFDDAVALALQLAEENPPAAGAAASQVTPLTTSTVSLFAKKMTMGAAMTALIAQTTVSAEQAAAANEELEAAGISGARLITEAGFHELEAKGQELTTAQAALKVHTDALATAGATDVAALVAERDQLKAQVKELGEAPGDTSTTAVRKDGASDVDESSEADANQKLIDELPHNKALANNPLFG